MADRTELAQRRRKLAHAHALGLLSDAEYLHALRRLRGEADELDEVYCELGGEG